MRQVSVPVIMEFFYDHCQYVDYVAIRSLYAAVVSREIKAGRDLKQTVQLARSEGELGA